MKIYKFYIAIAIATFLLTLGSCKEKKPQGPQPTEFEQAMTAKDTIAVKELVAQFFGYVKEQKFTDAAGMLYRNDDNKEKEPEQLDNTELNKVIGMLKSIPMVDYKIEYIKFNEDYANEVLCDVVMIKGENENPDVTTKMFFKPINYMGTWLLCLMNTEYGDKGVIKAGKRDSVEKDYAKKDTASVKK